MFNKKNYRLLILSFVLILCLPQIALPYVGPGTGLSAIGAFLALLAGIIVSILGFLWYPLKRILGKKKSQEPDQITNKDD